MARELCELCGRTALYRAYTRSRVQVLACEEHRSITVDQMTINTAAWDARYHAAKAAKGTLPMTERPYKKAR